MINIVYCAKMQISVTPCDFSNYFNSYTDAEQQIIIEELVSKGNQKGQIDDKSEAKPITCPHCKSNEVRGNGKLKGVRLYVFEACSKNSSETTARFWIALKKKDKMKKYLYCLLAGYSIRKSAK